MRLIHLIPLVLFVLLFIPTYVFAQNDNSVEESFDNSKNKIESNDEKPFFVFQLNVLNVLLAIFITVLVPIIYYKFQKSRRKVMIKKIWKTKKKEIDAIEISATNPGTESLKNITFDLEKLETLVSGTFSAEDFIGYTQTLRQANQLIDNNSTPRTQVLIFLKDWLVKLDSN